MILAILITAGYISLQVIGIDGFDMIYKIIIVVVVIYCAVRVLGKSSRLENKDAFFAGALGIGALAVSEVYHFVYKYISNNGNTGLSICDCSDACSYLLFIASIFLLLRLPFKLKKVFRVGIDVVSIAIFLVTTYAIAINDSALLDMTAIVTAVFCLMFSIYLLYQSKKIRELKATRYFSYSMILLALVDIVVYFSHIVDASLRLQDSFIALYLPLYLIICEGLLHLRKEEQHG